MVSATTDSSVTLGFSTLLTLFFAFAVRLSIDKTLSTGEISFDLGFRGTSSLHPWVSEDLLHRGSLGRVQGHHLFEEVFEFSRVDVFAALSFSVSLPEEFGTTSSN